MADWKDLQPQLHPKILQCIQNQFKFETARPVQKQAIPLFLKHYDLAVEAQTGSGKTLAFLIPIFHSLLKQKLSKDNHIFALIVSPTRELAKQICEVAQLFNQSQIYSAIGGYAHDKDVQALQTQNVKVLIGTPGKLRQIFMDTQFQQTIKIKELEYLILDEADRLINQEFWSDIQFILEKLPKQRRTGLFSATLSAAKLNDLIKLGLRNPVKISLEKLQVVPKSLKNQCKIFNNRLEKINFLFSFIEKCKTSKIIVFFNTCASVDYYLLLFQQVIKEIKFSSMHGQMKQKKRMKIYEQFRNELNKKNVLFATDVIARGIDFTDVPLIIQFDPPQDPSFFVHRVGRTARSGRNGDGLLLLEENERTFIQYLKHKDINIEEENEPLQINDAQEDVKQLLVQDRDLVEKGKKAFISFIRSYKEHKLSVIFSFQNLNLGKVAQSFFLLRIPRIKEILGRKIDFVQSDIDPFSIPFKDKNKEKQFNEKKENREQKEEEKKQQIIQQRRVEFHSKYMGKEINFKNNKSLRKKVKRKNLEENQEEIDEEMRLVKKLKTGKISLQQFNEKMRELDPNDFEEEEFNEKTILSRNRKK